MCTLYYGFFSAKWVVMSICKSLGYKAKVLASLTNRYYLDINNKMNQDQLPKNLYALY